MRGPLLALILAVSACGPPVDPVHDCMEAWTEYFRDAFATTDYEPEDYMDFRAIVRKSCELDPDQRP